MTYILPPPLYLLSVSQSANLSNEYKISGMKHFYSHLKYSSPNASLAYVNQLAYIHIWPFSVNSRRHWLFLKAQGGLARWLVSLLMRSNQHESCRLTNNVTTVLTSFSHIRSQTRWQSDFDGIRKRANKQRLNRSIVWLADIFLYAPKWTSSKPKT